MNANLNFDCIDERNSMNVNKIIRRGMAVLEYTSPIRIMTVKAQYVALALFHINNYIRHTTIMHPKGT